MRKKLAHNCCEEENFSTREERCLGTTAVAEHCPPSACLDVLHRSPNGANGKDAAPSVKEDALSDITWLSTDVKRGDPAASAEVLPPVPKIACCRSLTPTLKEIICRTSQRTSSELGWRWTSRLVVLSGGW